MSSVWCSGGERRKEVEEEVKVEKLQGYFESYGNTRVCKWSKSIKDV